MLELQVDELKELLQPGVVLERISQVETALTNKLRAAEEWRERRLPDLPGPINSIPSLEQLIKLLEENQPQPQKNS
jgi:hypothetical protein